MTQAASNPARADRAGLTDRETNFSAHGAVAPRKAGLARPAEGRVGF